MRKSFCSACEQSILGLQRQERNCTEIIAFLCVWGLKLLCLIALHFCSQVAFVAGGDTAASRSIAIDDISFVSVSCKLQPIDKRKFEFIAE